MKAPVKLFQRKHPRLPLEIYREGHVFFLTLCTHERYRWFERHPELTRQAVATLQAIGQERGAVICAWSFLPATSTSLSRTMTCCSSSACSRAD